LSDYTPEDYEAAWRCLGYSGPPSDSLGVEEAERLARFRRARDAEWAAMVGKLCGADAYGDQPFAFLQAKAAIEETVSELTRATAVDDAVFAVLTGAPHDTAARYFKDSATCEAAVLVKRALAAAEDRLDGLKQDAMEARTRE
jgi:hypothetical protein